MRRHPAWAAVALAVSLVTGACGAESDAEEALSRTEDKLDDVRSGVLDMRMVASAAGSPEGGGVGFELAGPFSVAESEGRLPVADLEYTRITGDQRATYKFLSTGDAAYVVVDGTAYELPPAQVADLRARDDDTGGGGLDGLNLSDWIEQPRLEPAGEDPPTDRITGALDAIAALNDILSVSLELGVSEDDAPRRLEGDSAERVRRAVQSSSVEVLTGRDDRLLRRARVIIELGPRGQELRQALGRLAGARLAIDIAVDHPNRPVTVRPPAQARPASELPG